MPTLDISLPVSLMNILEALLQQLAPAAGAPAPAAPTSELLQGLFTFALVWSIGGTTDSAGRSAFDAFLRKLLAHQVQEIADRTDFDLGPGLVINYTSGLQPAAPPTVRVHSYSLMSGKCTALTRL